MSKKVKNNDKNTQITNYESMRQASEKEFDRLIIYLSSGGLIISLTIFDKFLTIKEIFSLYLCSLNVFKFAFVLQWILLVLSIVLMLTSHLKSAKSMLYLNNGYENIGREYENCVIKLNQYSFMSFILSIIVILITIIGGLFYV